MSVSIRLSRGGSKKKPFYRIVAVDKRKKRDGAFLENLGFYNPCSEPADINIKLENVYKWVEKGAQCTETVQSLINQFKKRALN